MTSEFACGGCYSDQTSSITVVIIGSAAPYWPNDPPALIQFSRLSPKTQYSSQVFIFIYFCFTETSFIKIIYMIG